MTGNRMTVTVEEAAEILGISRAFAYALVRKGELPSLRLGRRLVVPRRALEQLLEGEQHHHHHHDDNAQRTQVGVGADD